MRPGGRVKLPAVQLRYLRNAYGLTSVILEITAKTTCSVILPAFDPYVSVKVKSLPVIRTDPTAKKSSSKIAH